MDEALRLLFHELSTLPPDERERVLSERPIDPHVRAELESLLKHDSPGAHDFTTCVAEAADDVLRSAAAGANGRCGPYRLVRLLGSGGMGDVYLGERDGEIEQTVAVKLLGAGGRRAGWQGRFLRERRLLASLNHASIVHVIDAGHTENGRPFLVMEYVAGASIDVYASRIAVRDRLTLFLRVCEGVSHAHRRLIIHRDLKPSNILVDESGQPKLLDFGIAKLLDETRDATQTSERLLTPNYASPEQLSGGIQTTATDIYSLAAVLYKLLTDRSPNERDACVRKTGRPELARPSRLNPEIPADLDFILQKALRSEPEERYASVEAFVADIQAVLESRPIQARADDTWYRARKLLRRYSLPLAAVALVIASLSAGLFVANRERAMAERRFQQLRQLSDKVFDLDKSIRDLPGSTKARQRLVAASLGYLKGLAAEDSGDLELLRELGEGYWRVGRIQGVPTEFNLGEPAEASLKKAAELLDRVLASRPADRKALFDSAGVAHDRMILAQEEHRDTDARAHAREAAERLNRFLDQGGVTNAERDDAAATYGNIALAYLNMHLYAEALPFARRTVEIARSLRSPIRISQGLSLLASAFRYQGDLERALRTIREARQAANGASYPDNTARMFNLYGVLLREGMILGEDGGINLHRPSEAVAALQQAFDMAEEVARKDPNDAVSRSRVGTSGNHLANILRHTDPQRALATYDLAIRRLSEIHNSVVARRNRAMLLANSSYALRSLHRTSEAKQRVDAALSILKTTKDLPANAIKLDSVVYVALCAQADHEAETGNRSHAIRLYEDLLNRIVAAKPGAYLDFRNAPKLSRIYDALASLYRQTSDSHRAAAMQARRLELWRRWDHKLPNNSFVRQELLAALQ